MILKIVTILFMRTITCYDNEYKGHEFPLQYLTTENYIPSYSDLTYYVHGLDKTVYYLTRESNATDNSRSIIMFMLLSILRNIFVNERPKLKENEYNILSKTVKRAENDLSHYVYYTKYFDAENTAILFYAEIDLKAESIRNYHRGAFKKWILSKTQINEFAQAMDNLSLPKNEYVNLVDSMAEYYMSPEESDLCLIRLGVDNLQSIATTQLRPCSDIQDCWTSMLSSPSVAYALSHRYLNILLRHTTRRCYLTTEKEDNDLMDELCASMYREVVYIARRGFFSRDLFLEHIALCSFRGYEEFHRHHWFKKVTSWIDEDGCITENYNFLFNVTNLWLKKETDRAERALLRERIFDIFESKCHEHEMGLLTLVLAHAIRHTLHHIPIDKDDINSEATIKRLDL